MMKQYVGPPFPSLVFFIWIVLEYSIVPSEIRTGIIQLFYCIGKLIIFCLEMCLLE